MLAIGDIVETINGVGKIEDIRLQGGEIAYLICTGNSGFGGCRDVYGINEFQLWETTPA